MNPSQPQVPDSVAMAQAIQGLPPAPAPTNVMGGQPPIAPPPVAPPAAPPAPEPEGDGFFGTPASPTQPIVPQYPTPPPMPPQPAPAPVPPAPGQPAAPVAPPAAPPVPDPNAIPIGLPQQPAPAPAPQPGEQVPAWAQEVIDAAAQIKASQSGQPAPGTVPAGAPAPGQPAEWKPNDWTDVDRRIEERAQQLFQQGMTQLQSQQQAQAEAEQQALAEADRAIDASLDQLRATGYLPPITDASNREDPGVAAQRELIAYTIAQGTDDLTKTAPVLYALHQSGYFFDLQQNKLVRRGSQTAAAQAPVAGATPSVSAPQAGQITYRDLATMDLHALADKAAQTYPTDNSNMNL